MISRRLEVRLHELEADFWVLEGTFLSREAALQSLRKTMAGRKKRLHKRRGTLKTRKMPLQSLRKTMTVCQMRLHKRRGTPKTRKKHLQSLRETLEA
jgi:hypothetical protein